MRSCVYVIPTRFLILLDVSCIPLFPPGSEHEPYPNALPRCHQKLRQGACSFQVPGTRIRIQNDPLMR